MMKKIALLTVAVAMCAMIACTGPFKLTRSLHDWQTGIKGPWVEELCFLALVIFPVYGATLFCDGVIFNSIEFWTGNNPIASNMNATLPDGTQIVLEKTGNAVTAKDLNGNVMFTAVRDSADNVTVFDADGACLLSKPLTAMAQ